MSGINIDVVAVGLAVVHFPAGSASGDRHFCGLSFQLILLQLLKAEAPRQNDFESVTTAAAAAATATNAALTENHITSGVVFFVVLIVYFRGHSTSACVQGQGGLSLESLLHSRVVGRGKVKLLFKFEPRAAVERARRSGFHKAPRHSSKRWHRSVKLPAARRFEPIGCRVQLRAAAAGRLLVFYISSPTFPLGVAKSCEAASFRPHQSSLLVYSPNGEDAGPSAEAGGRRAAVAAALEVGGAW
jgi:hypothetical protein